MTAPKASVEMRTTVRMLLIMVERGLPLTSYQFFIL